VKDSQVVEADWTWTGAAFEPGLQVVIGADGTVERVGRLDSRPTLRLRDRALLPGMVDAHSHAFQRGLRGRGERFADAGGSFWTWRQAMYELVERLDTSAFYRLTLQAFREMRAAGITTVGEFHYLHHGPDGEDHACDELVLKAAARAGVRLVLLQSFYKSGGVGKPLAGAQRRFRTADLDSYWRQMDRLAERLKPATQRLGAVAHSLRAATPEEIAKLYAEARRRGLVFHIHVEEQRQEIADCLAAYGRPPLLLLLERLGGAEALVAVHCTQTAAADLARLLAAGGSVCVCPTTEGNLGDGLPDLQALAGREDALCLGSDSNSRISMVEEMRWLEYGQRLRQQRRGVLRDAEGQVARRLFAAATLGGAAALGVPAGRIAPGSWADLVALDVNAAALGGADPQALLDAFVFGASEEAIVATCVAGEWREHRPPRS
jgi:formimidoylglutamate deiminase